MTDLRPRPRGLLDQTQLPDHPLIGVVLEGVIRGQATTPPRWAVDGVALERVEYYGRHIVSGEFAYLRHMSTGARDRIAVSALEGMSPLTRRVVGRVGA